MRSLFHTSEACAHFRIITLISELEVIVTSKFAIFLVVQIVFIVAPFSVAAHKSESGNSVLQQQTAPMVPAPQDDARSRLERDMAKKANEGRYAALKRDTDRLLRLSAELKAYVDKSSQNTLSLDVVKKAEEIEKLAHSVKEKMKGN
jgi:hypothetical protein